MIHIIIHLHHMILNTFSFVSHSELKHVLHEYHHAFIFTGEFSGSGDAVLPWMDIRHHLRLVWSASVVYSWCGSIQTHSETLLQKREEHSRRHQLHICWNPHEWWTTQERHEFSSFRRSQLNNIKLIWHQQHKNTHTLLFKTQCFSRR